MFSLVIVTVGKASYIYGTEYFVGFQNSIGDFLVSGSAEEMEFRTKTALLSYQGQVLICMSILDFSSNQFTGEIPGQLGDPSDASFLELITQPLEWITSKKLPQAKRVKESLDLSCNHFSVTIPQLQEWHFLKFFHLSHNNPSGSAPDKGQSATFGENSYNGNPLLSWSIDNSCRTKALLTPSGVVNKEEDESGIDMRAFCGSFVASYLTVLLAFVLIIDAFARAYRWQKPKLTQASSRKL